MKALTAFLLIILTSAYICAQTNSRQYNATHSPTTLQPKATKVAANEQDSLVLVILYNSTGGSGWTNNDNWLTDSVYKWYGILLDASGKVTQIDLHNNNLTGTIPPDMGTLSALQYLNLGYNNLSGQIPAELGNLSNLSYFNLENNNLSDTIPSQLGNLANLTHLILGINNLTGNIPPELGNLSLLGNLDLSNNALSGTIPPQLVNLANLNILALNKNNLSGNIPANLGNLSNLQYLYLSNNNLTGPIPPELGNLPGILGISLDGNNLSDTIPAQLGNLTTIQAIQIQNNNLSYNLADLSNCNNLNLLMVSNNNLDFGDLERFNINQQTTTFYYSPQANVPYSVQIVGCDTQKLYVNVQGTNNQYVWLKNSSPTPQTNYYIYLRTRDTGTYYCQITNPDFPNLIINSLQYQLIPHNVQFFVNFGGMPIENAQINLIDTIIYTGADGKAKIKLIDSKNFYTVHKDGYYDQSDSIFINGKDTTVVINMLQVSTLLNNQTKSNFSIFPNPNKGIFTILVPVVKEDCKITITSSSGRQLLTTTITQHSTKINISHEPPGLYFITLKTGNSSFTQKLIIK